MTFEGDLFPTNYKQTVLCNNYYTTKPLLHVLEGILSGKFLCYQNYKDEKAIEIINTAPPLSLVVISFASRNSVFQFKTRFFLFFLYKKMFIMLTVFFSALSMVI